MDHYRANFSHWTASELDAVMATGGQLCTFGQLMCHPAPDNRTLAGGWRIAIVGARGTGNGGIGVLVPSDQRTRRLHHDGRVNAFVAAGLPRLQAERLYRSRERYRDELLPVLAAAHAAGPECVRALAAFVTSDAWKDAGWSEVAGDVPRGLSCPRRVVLARLCRELWPAIV